ncbi:MAG: hypothetical protein KatS3mg114_0116 [Planctomycetaceae bacterium]|nr:MAG: hypothetical protein KatS3mg114_0116 [Planctomycetaceae bacterium]
MKEFPQAVRTLPAQKHVVLAGAGAVHWRFLAHWGQSPWPQAQLTLVTPAPQMYFRETLPLILTGQLSEGAHSYDLEAWCCQRGVRFLADHVTRLDVPNRQVRLASGDTLQFDLLSLDVGTSPIPPQAGLAIDAGRYPSQHGRVICRKPRDTFVRRWQRRWSDLWNDYRQAERRDIVSLVVVGGGRSGVELAFVCQRAMHQEHRPVEITLIEQDRILGEAPRNLRRAVLYELIRRGIEVWERRRVVGFCDEPSPAAILDDGTTVPCELALWTPCPHRPRWLTEEDLPMDAHGLPRILPSLQSASRTPVFIVGELAELNRTPLPNLSAEAARQAYVLFHNVGSWLRDPHAPPPMTYSTRLMTPQTIICGDDTLLRSWGWWTVRSHGLFVRWLNGCLKERRSLFTASGLVANQAPSVFPPTIAPPASDD